MATTPPLAVTLFFSGPSGYGWSERFWINPTLTGTALTFEVQGLINNRAGILTSNCRIVRARIQTSQVRNPQIYIPPGLGGTPGTETPPTSEQEVALLALAQAPGVGYQRPFLRGIPDRIVSADAYMPDMTFSNNFDMFAALLTDGNWFVNGNLGSSPTHSTISELTPLPPRGFMFYIGVTLTGLQIGSVVRVHGAAVPGYNGLKRVTNILPPVPPATLTQVTVGGAAPPIGDNAPSPYITLESLSNSVITSCVTLRISRRAAGRPFGQLRGRRATLYSLRR